jgi:hypothetical protein
VASYVELTANDFPRELPAYTDVVQHLRRVRTGVQPIAEAVAHHSLYKMLEYRRRQMLYYRPQFFYEREREVMSPHAFGQAWAGDYTNRFITAYTQVNLSDNEQVPLELRNDLHAAMERGEPLGAKGWQL